ncbi:MAG: DNA-directed RNA polymerase subunit alpha [Candidatus Magasanikbacteria bacterium]|nr:DNA-directed RNA polymerase subunit alpha [Candidatus Magasanikbacteria bacterium]
MEYIMLPNNISFQETENPHVGKLIMSPCQQGYGITLGNSMRRVLLASLPGAAVESVKIDGVQHEFSAIPGVKEDMVEVLLNLKLLAVRSHSDNPVIIHLKKKGKGPVTAADFEKNADIEIANPELHLFTMTDATKSIDMEVMVGKGVGYIPASEKETKNLDLGTIVADSLYTPIRDVGYKIDSMRVGDVTDYEKLVMTIETNGTITPRDAVHQATKILMDHFALVLNAAEAEATDTTATKEGDTTQEAE